MLFFELELVELQKGVPEGYMFVWLGDGPDPLFPAMDLNEDKEVPLDEVSREVRSRPCGPATFVFKTSTKKFF